MNIAIAINTFTKGGGMESYTLDMARELVAQQHSVSVYAAKIDNNLPETHLVQTHLVKQKHIPKKLRPIVFSAQLDKQRDKNQVLIACNRSENADVLICGGTHKGYLHHMRQPENVLDKLTIWRESRSYHSAKKIMAHSQMMARELVDLYHVPAKKIHTIYPPVDTARFHNDFSRNAQVRQKYGFADDEIVFLFPSTGHKRKGLDLLADFFEQTELPIKLAVAGSPLPRPMRNVLELGFVHDMPELYRAADYTIMASQYEPFGLVGVESVLSGTRVILSDNMACCEVLQEGAAGFFFTRGQPETLATAITLAVEHAQRGEHKIHDVQAALKYNPSIAFHIELLCQMLD
ncbi:glycosyltransferase family 4 protein [Wielerella bovis]|uniref:glycosyltransferase family 4 protein n=1 Tax=Wielerella bovis TaxID=2917790 RepID=UPI002018C9BF|nr:glycosyltransferase family 4 protein [Wielerella bovis]MCG7657634.1 glycosyltransferase family 4 protein [Wielerella bovis]MCG7659855.1 glycosyltransferase family 4 protein [Wielerella bovis]